MLNNYTLHPQPNSFGTIKTNAEQREKDVLNINFLPGSKMSHNTILAGFLACPGLKDLPIRAKRTVVQDYSIHKQGLQLRVQLRILTGFPLITSRVPRGNHQNAEANLTDYMCISSKQLREIKNTAQKQETASK